MKTFLHRLMTAFALSACAATSDPSILTYDEFKAKAYQEPDTQLYIINGDELVTSEQEMHEAYDAYVRQMKAAESGYSTTTQALAISRVGGVGGPDDKWSPEAANNITYCVSQQSFGSHYNAVVSALNTATANWEAAANVDFVHVTASDTNCASSTSGVVFNARRVTGPNPDRIAARAFFPSAGRGARELLIWDIGFELPSPLTLAGVMRHELGHVLGFRHEHVRPEALSDCTETNNWAPVTTYDSKSVMHYPQCNGSNTGDLVLTARDKAGVKLVYPYVASDILWRSVNGDNVIWFDANASAGLWLPALDNGWSVAGIGDFDGNGTSDILWRNVSGDNVIWFDANASSGLWLPALDSGWSVAGIGDFDSSGTSDILWRHVNGHNVIWLDGNASTGLGLPALDNGWSVAGIGDFDGNGNSDILWRNVSGVNVIWFDGNASSALGLPALDSGWSVAGIGDFDGNGLGDILWRSSNGDNVIWPDGNGGGNWIDVLDTGWRVAGIGDFDGDNRSDILWRHAGGNNAIWHGGSAFWTSYLAPLDNSWQIARVGTFAQ